MIILKLTPNTHFSPLYFMDGEELYPIGFLAVENLDRLKEKQMLTTIEQTEIIEKYFSKILLIKDISKCEYYQLNPQNQ
ncbi:MAG: hypothetical protein ACYCZ2_19630 [Lutibacter sp.]